MRHDLETDANVIFRNILEDVVLTMTRGACALVVGGLVSLSCQTVVQSPMPNNTFSPDAVLWKKRPIVIFGDFENSLVFQQARKRWNGFEERDIVFWLVDAENAYTYEGTLVRLPNGSGMTLTHAFYDGTHPVVLVGKDGGIKRRAMFDISSVDLFRQIDSMPMRQEEMKKTEVGQVN